MVGLLFFEYVLVLRHWWKKNIIRSAKILFWSTFRVNGMSHINEDCPPKYQLSNFFFKYCIWYSSYLVGTLFIWINGRMIVPESITKGNVYDRSSNDKVENITIAIPSSWCTSHHMLNRQFRAWRYF